MPDLAGRGALGQKAAKQPAKARSPIPKQSAKAKTPKPLREAAQGQPCTLRLDGCSWNDSNVFLCHIRRFGIAGMGEKPPDLCGVYACQNCHDLLDMRKGDGVSDTDVLRALLLTLCIVSKTP
jgi:hypothetical protein